ncbi:MAG: hypothetical protein R3C03_17780 [Pirellulaceae bacterium]
MIACDKTPVGLSDVIRGITTVSPLSFDLDLIEVAPYVNRETNEVMFVPTSRLATEIVARTTINVKYEAGSPKPDVSVEADSVATIIDNVADASSARRWTIEEVEEAFSTSGTEIEKKLFNYCKRESVRGQCVSPAVKKVPTVGLTLDFLVNGKLEPKMVFYLSLGFANLSLSMNRLRQLMSPEACSEFENNLVELFGEDLAVDSPMPALRYEALSEKVDRFLDIISEMKRQLPRV